MAKRIGLALALFLSAAPVQAGDLSGDVGVYSRYLDYDLYALTAEPVVQGGLYYQVTKGCQAMAWGSQGLATRIGGELDVGVYCSLQLAETTVTVGALRSFLRDVRDASTLSFGLARGGFDLTVERYLWDGNPSGTRVYGGYTWRATERLTVHPMAAYETGLGFTDIVAAGASAELALSGGFSLVALGLVPVDKAAGDIRSSELMTGLRYRF